MNEQTYWKESMEIMNETMNVKGKHMNEWILLPTIHFGQKVKYVQNTVQGKYEKIGRKILFEFRNFFLSRIFI